MLGTLARGELLRTSNFIGGRWLPAADGAQLDVVDPATLAVVAHVADSGAAEARAALDAAQAAFPAWRDRSGRERAQLLKKWYTLILTHQEDLARIISTEQGKPLAEARGEVLYGASLRRMVRRGSHPHPRRRDPRAGARQKLLAREGAGGRGRGDHAVELSAAMIARKIAPALAAGCTVVASPPKTRRSRRWRWWSWPRRRASRPASSTWSPLRASARPKSWTCWLDDARVRKITFTGSTPVGKHLARASADTLKKLSLELGGNAPFIVFEDADLDAAVEGLMVAKFRNGGQTCVCPNRVYVHDAVHDPSSTSWRRASARCRWGRPRSRARRSAR